MVKEHNLHVRGVDDETYKTMWSMRKKLKVKSWAELMKKVCESFREEIEEFEWL